MKRLLIALLLLGFSVSVVCAADTPVRGYTRKDGTSVSPYWRSTPDSIPSHHWGTHRNITPYTGQRGYRAPLPSIPVPSVSPVPWGSENYSPYHPFNPYRSR
jgi:hypothetical protein